MNILNRLLALTLIIILTTGVCAFAEPTIIPEDVMKSDYKQAIELVMALDIMQPNENLEFLPDNTITRAEFTSIITRMLKLDGFSLDGKNIVSSDGGSSSDEWMGSSLGEKLQQVQKPIFKDVPLDHWAYTSINVVAAINLMAGSTDGKFMPEEAISYEQATAVIVRMLGLGNYAELRGGYPMGYMATASEYKILLKTSVNHSAPITRGMMAELVGNSLNVDLVTMSEFGERSVFSTEKGKNLMTERLKIQKAKGVVTSVEMTGLYSSTDGTSKDQVKINNVNYYSNGIITESMLGKRITYYYSIDEKTKDNIVYVTESENDNVEIKFDTEDFISYENEILRYTDVESGIDKDINIKRESPVIYNGVYSDIVSTMNFEALNDFTSDVRLLDYDGDGYYDVIFVNCYKNYVARKIDTINNKVYVTDVCSNPSIVANSSETGYEPLDLDKIDVNYRYWRDGVAADIASIKEGMVISVGESINSSGKKLMDIHISTQKITGSISAIWDNLVTIGDKTYKLVPRVQIPMSVGMAGTFYLDVANKIAAYSSDDSVYDYAYLLEGKIKQGASQALEIKMFTKRNGTVEILTADTKVLFNDIHTLTGAQLLSELSGAPGGTTISRQLIAYKTNSKGLIKEIITPTVHDTWSNGKTKNANGDEVIDYTAVEGVIVRYPVGILSTYTNKAGTAGPGVRAIRRATRTNFNDFLIGKSGTIFDLASSDVNDWKIRTGMNSIKNGRDYDCVAYNITYGNVAGIMVIVPPTDIGNKAPIGGVSYFDDRPVTISKIISTIDADGNEYSKISGYKDGKLVDLTIDAARGSHKIKEMQVGDCWQIEQDDQKRVINCTELFDAKTLGGTVTYREKLTSDDGYDKALGIVKEVGEEALIIGVNSNTIDFNKSLLWTARVNQWGAGSTYVTWYDASKKTVEMKTTADILPDDLVFVVSNWNVIFQIIVVKNYK